MTAFTVAEIIFAIAGLAVILAVSYASTYGLKRPEKKEEYSAILHSPRYIMYAQAPTRHSKKMKRYIGGNMQPQRRFS